MSIVNVFIDACKVFNDAKLAGKYDALIEYLFPYFVIIHRVDDATPIFGSAQDIINNLNMTQALPGLWPHLQLTGAPHLSPTNPNVVSGRGMWTDRVGVAPIEIAYRYLFIGDQIFVGYAIPV